MKLVLFNENRLGAIRGSDVVDIQGILPTREYHHPQEVMDVVIAMWDTLRPKLEEAAAKGTRAQPLSKLKLHAPLPRPTKLVCAAVNYLENGQRKPAEPDGFIKPTSAIIGHGGTVVLPEAKATIFHHEAELGVVIGKRATKINAADWKQYVFGYTSVIDVSARGFSPNGTRSFFLVKSYDTFAPMGPALVTADEVPDAQNLQVRMWVDDQPRRDFNTSDMAYKLPQLLEILSTVCTLEPGDVVATGTNHQGIGPIQDGETVRMEIERLGPPLLVHVRDPLKRSWPKAIDKAYAATMIPKA